jgi:hypothetical protein
MQVDRTDANHPQAPGTNTTGIYWTITPTGSDYTASVTLPQAGLPAPMVCRYLASRWDWAQTSFDDTTVTRAGLTGFGDFAVFDNPQPIATTVTLGNLSQTWDGTAKAATATTSPANLTVTLTYDGSVNAPTNAGSYTVIGTVAEANYAGSATNTLVIAKAPATVTLGNLSQTYDGTAKSATASTTPDGLTVALTYNGSAAAPANAGDWDGGGCELCRQWDQHPGDRAGWPGHHLLRLGGGRVWGSALDPVGQCQQRVAGELCLGGHRHRHGQRQHGHRPDGGQHRPDGQPGW